jgi:branched-chain amino acid transport system permease protein
VNALIEYLVSGIAVGCAFALLGSGFVAIHRVTRVINFAQGAFGVLAGLMVSSLLAHHLPHGVAELLAVVAAAVAGVGVGLIAIGKRDMTPVAALVSTLGAGVIFYAIEIALWGDGPRSSEGIGGSFHFGGVFIQRQYVLVIVITLLLFGALWYFFTRTYLGKAFTACASNRYAAEVVGIDVRRMGLFAFGLGGALGGVAGVLIAPLQAVSFSSDVDLAVAGFAAGIFGGMNSFGSALVGGLMLGVAQSLVAGYSKTSYQSVVSLVLILGLMSWRAFRVHDRTDTQDMPAAPSARLWERVPRSVSAGLVGVALVAAALLPLGLSPNDLTIYVTATIYIIVAIGLSLLVGYAGQISVGQAAFMAIGAYTAALLSLHGVPTVIAFLAAPLMAALVATVTGVPLLRMRSHYLAFATIAIQLITISIISNVGFFGGAIGVPAVPLLRVGSFSFESLRSYAWLGLLAMVVVLWLSRNIMTSRMGRALRALSTSEIAAEAAGVRVGGYKLMVFAIAAGFSGLAGGAYAFFLSTITPDSFSVALSVEFIVMVIIGGLGTLAGAVVGGGVVVLLVQFLNQLGTRPGLPSYMPSVLSYAAYGGLLIAIILFLPRGLVPALTNGIARGIGGRSSPPSPSAGDDCPTDPARQGLSGAAH